MIEMIKSLYDYTSWANGRMLDKLAGLSPAQYTAPGCSGHDSIRETLAHMLSTHMGYFCFFDGSKTIEQSIALRILGEHIATVDAAAQKWHELDSQTHRFLETLTDDKLKSPMTFNIPKGPAGSMLLWQMMLQVSNHSTHHRAQIVAAIRRAGIEPGGYDYLHYLLFNK